jgi:hypothetical protein
MNEERRSDRARQRDSRLALLALLGALACAALVVWWMCARDPTARFFVRDARAEWVVYPTPPDLLVHPAVELETIFTRSFVLDRSPARARLSARLHRRGEIRVNGALVTFATSDAANWKTLRVADVSALVRPGPNQIVVRASSSLGPPALWLALEGDGVALRSDASWTASLAGATDLRARLATTPMDRWSSTPGTMERATRIDTRRDPRPLAALADSWPVLLAFAALSAGLVLGAAWPGHDAGGARAPGRARRAAGRDPWALWTLLLFIAAALATALLFWNNRGLHPGLGFDAGAHVEYIQYILDHGSLPLADQGWEMYHPPLYYLLAALVAKLGGWSRVDADAIAVVRWLGCLATVLQAWLVVASLRLLFPDRPLRTLAGLVLAVGLPVQLYLYQYVTNESLAAVLMSVSIYLALRILARDDTTLLAHLWLGVALGAAMLAKFSALVPLVIILVALAVRRYRRGTREASVWGQTLGVTTAACLVVCGWHFARVALRFGNPFIGNWDAGSGFAFWQDPGYAVPGYYLRFGTALTAPILSGMHSFADGIYSTLWGDGMIGGVGWAGAWPPWNYGLMSAGYLLALLPSATLVIGAAAAAWHLVREPRAEWFLVLGCAAALLFGLVVHSLRVPSYAVPKAFYGASALIPLCALGAWGLDLLAARARVLRAIVFALLGVWALNAYASYWSVGGASVALPPARAADDDPVALTSRAVAEQRGGQRDRAIATLRRVASIAPDDPEARALLAVLHAQAGEYEAGIAAAREALRVKPAEASVHAVLGDLYRGRGDRDRALAHYELSLRIHPAERRALDGRKTILTEMGR